MKRALMTRLISAAALACCLAAPAASFAGPDVNVNISGYLPAPPGVHVYVDGGRPYYVERERRVYMEREPRHRKRHHDNGKHRGWDKEHGHGNGHGHGKNKH
jgi:hypothetical protein